MRVVIYLVLNVLFLVNLQGAEMRERAYYFGPQDLEDWKFSTQDDSGDDPFSDREMVEAESVRPLALKAVPYESVFFGEGDQLWDLKPDLEKTMGREVQILSAVYNQSTGRFVLRGTEYAHSVVSVIAEGNAQKLPRMIQSTLQVFKVPRRSFGVTQWDGLKLANEETCLAEIVCATKPGQKASSEVGDGLLSVEIEPNVGMYDEWVDIRAKISGSLEGEDFKISTGMTGFNGYPFAMELGAIGQGDVLVLTINPEIYFASGVKWSERVLDPKERGSSVEERLLAQYPPEVKEVDSETGKVFKSFQVPPTIISFLDIGDGTGESDDPFADDESPVLRSSVCPVLMEWSPKVIARKGDRVLDLRGLLQNQGVKFSDGDFAVMIEGQSSVSIEVGPEQMELVEAILDAGGLAIPRMVTCSVALIRGTQKIVGLNLERGDLRCVGKSVIVGKPGLKSSLELVVSGSKLVAVLEPNVGAFDDLIDLRVDFSLQEEDRKLSGFRSGVASYSGHPIIAQQFYDGESWFALLVESKITLVGEIEK